MHDTTPLMWFFLALAVAGAVSIIMIGRMSLRDERRARRGKAAGDAAQIAYRLRELEREPPLKFKACLDDHGASGWQWTMWDGSGFDPARVEGHLVPYAIAHEPTRDEAELAATYCFEVWRDQQPDPSKYSLSIEIRV